MQLRSDTTSGAVPVGDRSIRATRPKLARVHGLGESDLSTHAVVDDDSIHSAVNGTLLANFLGIANIVIRVGTTFALMPVLIAALGEEHFALWITISTVTSYLSLSEAGLGQTIVNRVGDAYARGDFEQARQTQATAFVLYWMLVIPMGLATLTCLVLLPIDGWLLTEADAHHGQLLTICLMFAAALALVRIPFLVFPAMLSAFRELPIRLFCEAGFSVLVAVGTFAAAVAGLGLIGVTVTTNVLLLVSTLAAYLLSTRGRLWARLRWTDFRYHLLWPLAANSGFFFLISGTYLLDRSMINLLVAKLGSLTLVPPVFLCMCVFRVAGWSLLSAISQAVQPYIILWHAQQQKDRIQFAAQISSKMTCVLGVLLSVTFIPLAEPLVNWWLDKKCFPGVTPLLFIVGSFLVDAVFLASVNMLVVLDRHRLLAVVLLGKSLLMLAMGALLASLVKDPIVGLTGGVFLATLVSSLAIPLLFRRVVWVEFNHYMEHFLVRPISFCVLSVFVATCMTGIPDLMTKVLLSIMGAAAACAVAWFAVLDASERHACASILRRFGMHSLGNTRVDAS